MSTRKAAQFEQLLDNQREMFGVEIMIQDCPRCGQPCDHEADVHSVLAIGHCTTCEHFYHDAEDAQGNYDSGLTVAEMSDLGILP